LTLKEKNNTHTKAPRAQRKDEEGIWTQTQIDTNGKGKKKLEVSYKISEALTLGDLRDLAREKKEVFTQRIDNRQLEIASPTCILVGAGAANNYSFS